MAGHYLIVADDFTGANDTGVQLRRRGIDVNVVFSSALMDGNTSVVIDTESRARSPQDAYEKIKKELTGIDFSRFSVVMKKVDSTLRGNIAQETRAVYDAYKPDIVIFAPALPDLGRTTVDKIHRINGTPVTQTELARDPKTPVIRDDIQKIMEDAFTGARHITLNAVRAGLALEPGVYACDAETNADMRAIINAAQAARKRVLWVGTAAMADNILALEYTLPPALAVVTSLSSVTRQQIIYAEKNGVKIICYPVHDLLSGKAVPRDFAAPVIESLAAGHDTALVSAAAYDMANAAKSDAEGKKRDMSTDDVSCYVQETLGPVTVAILKAAPVSGLFLAGGDTAIGFFGSAESRGSRILGEIAVGIPLMRLSGGEFDGLKVITKAGAFGKEDAIFYALRKLREKD